MFSSQVLEKGSFLVLAEWCRTLCHTLVQGPFAGRISLLQFVSCFGAQILEEVGVDYAKIRAQIVSCCRLDWSLPARDWSGMQGILCQSESHLHNYYPQHSVPCGRAIAALGSYWQL